MGSNQHIKLRCVLPCFLLVFLFSSHSVSDDSPQKPVRFGPGIPRLGIGVGVPQTIEPGVGKSVIVDTTLGFRIIGRRSRFTPGPRTIFRHGWRITPEIGYLLKRDTIVENQKKYLRLFCGGIAWTYVFRKTKFIGIGTNTSFLIGKYDGLGAKGVRNGFHFGLWDILVFDLSYIWVKQNNDEKMKAFNMGLSIDVLSSVLFLIAAPFAGATQL